jgi:hypothetical protein
LLSDRNTYKLLRWVVRSGHFAAIENLIKLKTATTEIFASNILLSSIRIGYKPTVEALIALGIDVNIPGGSYPKETALSVAVRNSIVQKFLGRQEDIPLVMLLVDAGADINAKSGWNNVSPLQEAISKKHVQLVQILLNSGPILDAPANELDFPGTVFLKAARDGDFKLLERLLDMLQPSMITFLQTWQECGTIQTPFKPFLMVEQTSMHRQVLFMKLHVKQQSSPKISSIFNPLFRLLHLTATPR